MTGPTRIVKAPERVRPDKEKHGTNTTHSILLITCDDGCEYTIDQLAKKKDMTRQKLYWRLGNFPWDHPEILNEKMSDAGKGGGVPRAGNSAWKQLSGVERKNKLAALPHAGILERRDCHR